jgi:hypothetical protein
LRSESGRDATEKRARMGGLPNSDGSERKRTGPIWMGMRSEQGFARGGQNMRRLEDRGLKGAKLFPKEQGPR